MPNTRCPMSVATECSTSLGSLASRKHRAIRRTRSRRWSAAPNSRPPELDVSAPPSNSATTDRPSTRPTRSVPCYTPSASGRLSKSAQVVIAKQLLPDLATRCAIQFEKCGLACDQRRLARRRCEGGGTRNILGHAHENPLIDRRARKSPMPGPPANSRTAQPVTLQFVGVRPTGAQ